MMFEKKIKVQYTFQDHLLGTVTKTKKMTEAAFSTFKESADIKILSVDGKPYRK